jgi:hypothetical protein
MKKIIALGKFTLAIAALALLSGCLVVDVPNRPVGPGIQNETPYMVSPNVQCYWDPYYGQYIWDFDVWSENTTQVWVDAYDRFGYVDSIPLFREDGQFWSSWWLEQETNLWCGDYYSFDFIAVDRWGNSEIVTRTY